MNEKIKLVLLFICVISLDMATQNVIGDSFRGATWVALHNGGGTGFGEAINGIDLFVCGK